MPRTRSQKGGCHSDSEHSAGQRQAPRKQIAKVRLSKRRLRAMVSLKFQSSSKKSQTGQTGQQSPQSQHLEEVVPLDKLNCPICMEALVAPTLTECGHSFCLPCVEEAIKYKGTCPICRAPLNFNGFTPSPTISSLLTHKLSASDPHSLACQRQRQKVFRENDLKCRVGSDVKVGELLDFWAERKWRQGRIVDINFSSPQNPTVTIEPTHQWPINDQQSYEFSLSTRLIAKHRTHTKEEIARLNPRGITQFRIEIRNIGDEEPLFFQLMGHRRMEFALRDVDDSNDSMVRFALSFESRRSQQRD